MGRNPLTRQKIGTTSGRRDGRRRSRQPVHNLVNRGRGVQILTGRASPPAGRRRGAWRGAWFANPEQFAGLHLVAVDVSRTTSSKTRSTSRQTRR